MYTVCQKSTPQWSFRKLTTMGTPKLSAEGARIEGVERGGVWGGVSPPQPTRGSGERRKLPQRGPGRSPGRQRVLPYFRVKKTSFWTAKCILRSI